MRVISAQENPGVKITVILVTSFDSKLANCHAAQVLGGMLALAFPAHVQQR